MDCISSGYGYFFPLMLVCVDGDGSADWSSLSPADGASWLSIPTVLDGF